MKPPIIIVEGSEVEVYESVQEVGIYLEPAAYFVDPPIDVRIAAYDSLGYILDLSEGITEVENQFLCMKWKRRYEGVKLTKKIPEEKRMDELRDVLIDFLIQKTRNVREDLQNETITELIIKAAWW